MNAQQYLFVALLQPAQHCTRQKWLSICLAFGTNPPFLLPPFPLPLTDRELTKGSFITLQLNAFITSWISLLTEQLDEGTCFTKYFFVVSRLKSVAVFTLALIYKLYLLTIWSTKKLELVETSHQNAPATYPHTMVPITPFPLKICLILVST